MRYSFLKQIVEKAIVIGLFLQSSNPFITSLYAVTHQQPSEYLKGDNFIADNNLNQLIKYIVEDAVNANISDKNIVEPLKRCYRTLAQGTQILPIEDVWQAMPNILQYVVDYHTRSPRPNEPITASNAIVGPGSCDTIQLLELLVTIKNRIGCVTDDVCCNTILGVLGDACKIFGGDDTISSILIKILNAIDNLDFTNCCTILIAGIDNLSDQVDDLSEDLANCCTTIIERIDTINMDIDSIINEINECCENLNELIIEEHIETRTIILNALEECCENIRNDILDTQTQLAECCENLSKQIEDLAPCAPTPISGPTTITESGAYCLTQNIAGTIVIDSDNVDLDLNDFEVQPLSPGIIILSGHHNISIKNGVIVSTNVNSSGIQATDCTNIEINNVSFIVDAIGIGFNNITNFTIHDTQFTNYTDTVMSFTNSSNGKITNSQIHNNNNISLITALTLIDLNDCNQILFDGIIITENTNIQTLRCINGVNTHECIFENVQITYNEATQDLKGLRLQNCDDNIVRKYTVNKNSVSSTNNSATLIGFVIFASVDGGSKNNIITECQVHENTSNSTGENNFAALIGAHIAGFSGPGNVSNNACVNTTINATSVASNTCTSQDFDSFFVGINFAGPINGGSVGDDVCANCNVTNCSVTKNSCSGLGANNDTMVLGINFGGAINPTGEGPTVVGTNACKNCHITACDISDNTGTSTASVNNVTFIGINLSGALVDNAIVGDNGCASCSVNDSTINNNTVSSAGDYGVFIGINLGGTVDSSTVNNNVCASCAINNCTVNNNSSSHSAEGGVYFVGINLAGTLGGTIGTDACTSCKIATCGIQNNICFSQNGNASFAGINLASAIDGGSIGADACANCTITNCKITQNNSESQGSGDNTQFIGINLAGVFVAPGGGETGTVAVNACKNCHVSSCDVSSTRATAINTTILIGINLGGAFSGDNASNTVNDNACASCSVSYCTLNNNSCSSNGEYAVFTGINLSSTIDTVTITNNGCASCSINNCAIDNNSCTSSGVPFFIGINLAGTLGGTIGTDACTSCKIATCGIQNNTCFSQNGNASFVGINLASVIEGGSIGANACANCTITNCTVTQNKTESQGSSNNTQFIGINLAGVFVVTNGGGTVAVNACKNCHVSSCDVSSTSATAINTVILIGINLGGAFSGNNASNTVNDNACASCSVSYCTLNNNNCSSNGEYAVLIGINLSSTIDTVTITNNGCASCSINNCAIDNNSCISSGVPFFIGINLAGTLGGILGTNICESCSISNCTINNNNDSSSGGTAWFVGINFGGIVGGGTPAGNNCNNCKLDTISIYQNTLTSNTSSGFLRGITMNGTPGTANGGCSDITCNQCFCFIEGNTIQTNGLFTGFFIDGTGAPGLTGGCNNVILKTCEIHHNTGFGTSQAYHIVGTNNGGIGGADNIQLENCTAKQNLSSGTLTGFSALDISNAILSQCTSIANTTNGFLLQSIIDSSLQECQALNNGVDGFNFSGTTQQVTITNSQALGNLDDGFSFATTTTQCHIRANIAQNNNGIGFNNEGGDQGKHQFFGNFAQGNGTNYSGVALVTSPNLTTSSFANAET